MTANALTVDSSPMSCLGFYKFCLLAAGCVFLAACSPEDELSSLGDKRPTRSALTKVATAALAAIQPRSIRENREFCGVLYVNKNAELKATPAVLGGADWCLMPAAHELDEGEEIVKIVADYHTHAAYDKHSDSEVPSIRDMNGNAKLGIPGFVSTPGGRLWYVSETGQFSEQICGVGCLSYDANFQPEKKDWFVRTRYTKEQMIDRQKNAAEE